MKRMRVVAVPMDIPFVEQPSSFLPTEAAPPQPQMTEEELAQKEKELGPIPAGGSELAKIWSAYIAQNPDPKNWQEFYVINRATGQRFQLYPSANGISVIPIKFVPTFEQGEMFYNLPDTGEPDWNAVMSTYFPEGQVDRTTQGGQLFSYTPEPNEK